MRFGYAIPLKQDEVHDVRKLIGEQHGEGIVDHRHRLPHYKLGGVTTTFHVIPHTHWDREWYEPFESYRFKLVKVLDRLLDVLEHDASFRHFNFDGQTAAIEDYLEVRPEEEPRVARAVRDGRLAIAPWRILMDEFLCSPETIVRNLQQGAATARRLGGGMRVGHIPDSFGHIAQMPQILRLAGLDTACVWRGVPRAVDRTTFLWIAPDGSSVKTAYMATSYSNGVGLPNSPEELLARAVRISGGLAPFHAGDVLLVMNGTDHRGAEEHIPELFAKANALQDDMTFRIGTFEEYVAVMPEPAIEWRGEMRSGARANLLMGVASARVPLKQAEFEASAELERYAEPLQAIAGTETGALLDRAWRWMVENSAHDSICGCGVDAVAAQVHERYIEAHRIASLASADALAILSERIRTAGGVVVFNPSPRARDGIVEVTLNGAPRSLAMRAPDGTLTPAQVLEVHENVAYDTTLTGPQLARLAAGVNLRALGSLFINGVRVEQGRKPRVLLDLGTGARDGFDIEAARRDVEAAIAHHPRGSFRVIGTGPPLVRALVGARAVPALGWSALEPVEGTATIDAPARAHGHTLDNGLVQVAITNDGRVSITAAGSTWTGLLGFEDGADAGDEYNYSPPEHDLVVTEPVEPPVVDEFEDGPLRASLRVTARYRIPIALATNERRRARRTTELPIVTTLALHAGEPFVRATIDVVNDAADHRLRAVFALPFRADRSHADAAFHVTERGLVAEGGDHEHGLATFPCRRWVDVSDGARGLAIFHRGTPEYELTEDTLAVTLLRSVGWLSRSGMRYRAGGAGPSLPTPGAQLRGTHRFELALYPHAGDWRTADVHGEAERFAYPLRAALTRAHSSESGGDLAPEGSALSIEPACVQLSAFEQTAAGVSCRVVNASPEPVRARITLGPAIGPRVAAKTGILGDVLEDLGTGDAFDLALRPFEIATIGLG